MLNCVSGVTVFQSGLCESRGRVLAFEFSRCGGHVLRAQPSEIVRRPRARVLDAVFLSAGALEGARVEELVRRLREQVPFLPVVLAVPVETEYQATLAVTRSPSLCSCHVVAESDEVTNIRRAIETTLADAPVARVARILTNAMPSHNGRLYSVLDTMVRGVAIAHDHGLPTVASVAKWNGLSCRTVERALRRLGLPNAKRVCDWVTMAFVAFTSCWSGIAMPRVRSSLRIDSNRWYRLRRRLLGRTDVTRDATALLDLSLLAFRDCCIIPTDSPRAEHGCASGPGRMPVVFE